MRKPLARFSLILAFLGAAIVLAAQVDSQEPPFLAPPPQPAAEPAPDVPKGFEVMARGPVHEAFASPSQEAQPTQPIAKKPPAPVEEMPPEDRPEGDVVWIGGYWSYDDDRQDFLWVSGCWRVKPPSKEWVPGYWREVGVQWQWVAGFWAATAPAGTPNAGQIQDVTYYPDPPAAPKVAPPGNPPNPDMFYVPGYYQWTGTHYVSRAGYWTRIRQGYVYVPSSYRWTPSGYVFVAGYWDYTVASRGVMYAPVVINPALVPAGTVYTPAYAVSDGLVLDAMFVNPAYGHYYFGDYYGPAYANRGYVTTVVYSRSYYEPIVVYQRWQYRDNPRWYDTQINIVFERNAGRLPVPPRTLVQQQTLIVQNNTTIINNVTVNNKTTVVQPVPGLAPAKTLMAARGIPMTKLDPATRVQVKQTARAVQAAAVTQRARAELAPRPAGAAARPRPVSLAVPATPIAPKAPAAQVSHPAATAPAKLGATQLGGTSPAGAKGATAPVTPSLHPAPGPVQPKTPGSATLPGTVGTPHPAVNPNLPRPALPPAKKAPEKKKN